MMGKRGCGWGVDREEGRQALRGGGVWTKGEREGHIWRGKGVKTRV